jgi:hypothetical protein
MAAIQLQSEVVVKPKHPYGAVAVWSVLFFGFATSMCAQQVPTRTHIGAPQDWSDRHIVFSRRALAEHPELIYREPRIFNQARQRWRTPNPAGFHRANPIQIFADKSAKHRDWSVDLGTGRLDANMFPAKYSFNPDAAPSCTDDYVVFGLASSVPGKANLVAFNNLYANGSESGPCAPVLAPTVLFAYNITTATTDGKIVTSPILSEDGTQIAFVESVNDPSPQSIFHVLTWTAGQGTLGSPFTPTSMTSLPFSTAYDTSSSPWIDYDAGTVYVGADSGLVYQITDVFSGTPTLSASPWPVTVSSGYHLTSPVLDANLGVLMIGSANGSLYQVSTTSGALKTLVVGAVGGTTPGIVAPPIVDVTNGTTFVVTADDGISAALVEVDTSTDIAHSKAEIGEGSHGGTPVTLYEPAFSNAYYNEPSSGVITVCGTSSSDTSPWQYSFGFTGIAMKESSSSSLQLSISTTDSCTAGWTEFFNPDINSGVDFFFFGLSGDCSSLGTSGSTTGCVVALSSDSTIPTASATVTGGTSGIIVDNYSAANIYFAAGSANTAYQFTQDGLK